MREILRSKETVFQVLSTCATKLCQNDTSTWGMVTVNGTGLLQDFIKKWVRTDSMHWPTVILFVCEAPVFGVYVMQHWLFILFETEVIGQFIGILKVQWRTVIVTYNSGG